MKNAIRSLFTKLFTCSGGQATSTHYYIGETPVSFRDYKAKKSSFHVDGFTAFDKIFNSAFTPGSVTQKS